MATITFRPDDSGIQSLRKENEASSTRRAAEALQAIAKTRPVSEKPPGPPQAEPHQRYTGPERRKAERRKAQTRVILDTRGNRERRRQVDDALDAEAPVSRGVDLYG